MQKAEVMVLLHPDQGCVLAVTNNSFLQLCFFTRYNAGYKMLFLICSGCNMPLECN